MTPVTAKNITDRNALSKMRQEMISAGYQEPGGMGGLWTKPKASQQSVQAPAAAASDEGGGTPAKAAPRVPSAAEIQAAKEAAERNALRGGIGMTADDILRAFDDLFGRLDVLLKDRAKTVEGDYGKQFEKAASEYAKALPMIEQSYAAIGAGDSTNVRDANIKAKEGLDETTGTIAKNRDTDLAKIAQYGTETKAKWNADKNSVNTVRGRLGEVEDLGQLRETRNNFENKLGSLRADAGTLETDAGARGQLSALTQDAGRSEGVLGALEQLMKGSMSGAVKGGAAKAVLDSAGLSEEDRKRVQAQYGNVFTEQSAL